MFNVTNAQLALVTLNNDNTCEIIDVFQNDIFYNNFEPLIFIFDFYTINYTTVSYYLLQFSFVEINKKLKTVCDCHSKFLANKIVDFQKEVFVIRVL